MWRVRQDGRQILDLTRGSLPRTPLSWHLFHRVAIIGQLTGYFYNISRSSIPLLCSVSQSPSKEIRKRIVEDQSICLPPIRQVRLTGVTWRPSIATSCPLEPHFSITRQPKMHYLITPPHQKVFASVGLGNSIIQILRLRHRRILHPQNLMCPAGKIFQFRQCGSWKDMESRIIQMSTIHFLLTLHLVYHSVWLGKLIQ